MKTKQKESLIDLLQTLKDPRRSQGRRHPLSIVLLILIMAVMSGAKGERAVSRFAKNNKKSLIKHLGIERKEVPSRSVIQSVVRQIDFSNLEEVFSRWMTGYLHLKEKDLVNIDGKAIRGTVKDSQNSMHNFVSLVSVFVSKKKLVLASHKVEIKKESEIPVVQILLKMLDLEGITFTLDALHCQKETLNIIEKKKNHYVVGVKKNQPKLYEDVKKKKKENLSVKVYKKRKESGKRRNKNRKSV